MNKILPLLAAVVLLLASCNSSKEVLYFQDVQNGESFPTKALEYLKYQPGDKVSVLVSSAATPDLARNYNLVNAQQYVGAQGRSSNNSVALYTIDRNGNIDIPSLGTVGIAGLTRDEAQLKIQNIFHNGILNDAVVTVSSFDQFVTVLGEVKSPGRVNIGRDNLTLLEAIGQVGDLTIQARRDRILVMRQEGDETKSYYVDIRSKDIMNSPAYNLRQNDIIVVEPNPMRIGQSTYNENSVRQISTWLSVSSVLISIAILIFK
ncbi:MAG: polysaccharide biosynthesis/export family protein [Alloprevotella sp.]|nr:polysaccharide biosynthesis/export family protein [Alloprevotella sp.]